MADPVSIQLSRPGLQNNQGADERVLFQRIYMAEVLAAFKQFTVMEGTHIERAITHGKSAVFPAMWKTDAQYFVPGGQNQLLGENYVKHNERVIQLDNTLLSNIYVAEVDELMNHYDIRGEYARQQGQALAVAQDSHLIQVAILSARTTAKLFGNDAIQAEKLGGSVITKANADTDAAVLASCYFDAARTLDEKDIPQGDRYSVLAPLQYYMLAQNLTIQNTRYGGAGQLLEAKVPKIAGIEIKMSNNIKRENLGVADPEDRNGGRYKGDFSHTVGPVWHRTGFGTVSLQSIAVESKWMIDRQSTLIVAKYLKGHGILRPESCVEIARSATPPPGP